MQIRDTVEFYQDAANLHRWRYVARNGRTMADSGQGYHSHADALHGANKVTGNRVLLGLVKVVQKEN